MLVKFREVGSSYCSPIYQSVTGTCYSFSLRRSGALYKAYLVRHTIFPTELEFPEPDSFIGLGELCHKVRFLLEYDRLSPLSGIDTAFVLSYYQEYYKGRYQDTFRFIYEQPTLENPTPREISTWIEYRGDPLYFMLVRGGLGYYLSAHLVNAVGMKYTLNSFYNYADAMAYTDKFKRDISLGKGILEILTGEGS